METQNHDINRIFAAVNIIKNTGGPCLLFSKICFIKKYAIVAFINANSITRKLSIPLEIIKDISITSSPCCFYLFGTRSIRSSKINCSSCTCHVRVPLYFFTNISIIFVPIPCSSFRILCV